MLPQIGEHAHVRGVIAQRKRIVLQRHQVQSDKAALPAGQLKAEQALCEHLLGWEGANHLSEVSNRQAATGLGAGFGAVQQITHPCFRGIYVNSYLAYDAAETPV